MFTQNLKRGFTLIELLVVISIIGVMASIVLSSVNSARNKGADAAIKSNLANMRAQAALQYDTAACYGTSGTDCVFAASGVVNCSAGVAENTWKDTNIEEALAAAGKASTGGGIAIAVCNQAVNGGAWAISVPLKSASTSSWCIDSSGSSKTRNGQITTTNC